MLSVCSKHLPQESKFQQKLAEMSEYILLVIPQQRVPRIKQFVSIETKTLLSFQCLIFELAPLKCR